MARRHCSMAFAIMLGALLVGLLALGRLAWAASGDTVADRVLGQPNFTSGACTQQALTASNLCAPEGVAVDAGGRLYVADTNNNRVLSWPNAASFTNGQAADMVFGQGGSF